MKKRVLFVSLALAGTVLVKAQNVGISDVSFTPNAQAILDLSADRKGFLPPRIALVDANDPINGTKPQGLMVYNQGGSISGGNGYYYWDGSAWQKIPNTNSIIGGSGTVNYLSKWTPDGGTLGNSLVFDNGSNVGIGTNMPASRLNLRDGQESVTQTDFTQGLGKAGLLITSDYTDNSYMPGLFWNTANNNPTKPKAGIYLHQGSAGSKMILSTTTNYSSGLDNNGVVINDLGYVGFGTLTPSESFEIFRNGSNPVASFHSSGVATYKLGNDGNVFKIAAMDNGYGGSTGNFAANDVQVISLSNVGNVGIGNAAPSMKLHVNAAGDNGIGISASGWASVRMDGADNKSLWIHYGSAGTNDLRFARTGDGFGSWEANVVRFDMDAPGESLVLDGSGNLTVGTLAGSGTRMVTASASGAMSTQALPGGVLPAGSSSQTLYHNGTSWVNTSNLTNTGSTINLGQYTNNDADEWPYVTWRRDVDNSWDEGLIKGSSARGAWGRTGFGIHMHSSKHFGFYSSGWNTLFDIEGGTGRVYIQGNTGIGGSNPLAKLEVDHNGASVYGVGILVNQNVIGNSDGPKLQFRKTMTSTKDWSVGILNGVDVGTFGISENGGVSGFGTSRLSIITGGNVGIGSNSPGYKLDVAGTLRAQGWTMIGTGADRLSLELQSTFHRMAFNELRFYDWNSGADMVAFNNGNVGVGTASPQNTLHVERTTTGNRATMEVVTPANNSWGQMMMLRTTNVGTDGAKLLFRSRDTKNWSIGGNNGTDNAFVITEDGGDGVYGSGFGTTRMYFQAGGNVGIANTAPASKLHIGASNTDGVMIGNYNDRFGWDGTGGLPYTAIRFPGYRDVVNNFSGAMIAAVRTNLCCSGLSQATDLSFFVQPYTATASGDGNLYERFRVTAPGVYATDYYYLSDKRLKSDVRDIEYGLDKVLEMKPVSYTQEMPRSFRDEAGREKSDVNIESFGFIAQDLYEVVPDLVAKPSENDPDTYWTVSYGKITPILVKAIQEQQQQLEEGEKEREELRKEIEELKKMISAMSKKN